jgi:hypothetical protein
MIRKRVRYLVYAEAVSELITSVGQQYGLDSLYYAEDTGKYYKWNGTTFDEMSDEEVVFASPIKPSQLNISGVPGPGKYLTSTDGESWVWDTPEGTSQLFLGVFTSLASLEAAYPDAEPGQYAQVDAGVGNDVINYAWDEDDAAWVQVGGSALGTTDDLPEGGTNKYFTEARVRSTVLTGFAASAGIVSASDSVLQAFQKLQYQVSAIVGGASFVNTNVFVSPTGNDLTAVKGDPSKPYTVAGGVAAAVAGDTIVFLAGTYNITGNIADNDVYEYTTFGGPVYLEVTTASVIIWDYSVLTNTGITSPIRIVGDFHITLNASSAGGIKLPSGVVDRNIVFKFTFATLTQGQALIYTPLSCLPSHFEGVVKMDACYTILGNGTTFDGRGSYFKLTIHSTSTTHEAFNWSIFTGGMNNIIFDVAYYNNTSGGKGMAINAGGATNTRASGRIVIVQPTGATTQMPGGVYDLTIEGGTIVLNGTSKFSIAGFFYNCTIQGNAQINATIIGYYKSCTLYNNQCNQFVLDGHSVDCTLAWASSQITTLKGVHYDIQGSGGSLIIDANVKWLTGQYFQISYNRTLKICPNARLIGNINGAGVVTSVGLPKCEIYGEVKNNNTGSAAHVLYHYNANSSADYIFKLKNAILVTKGAAGSNAIYVLSTFTGYVQMLGQSFANVATGGAGTITYTVGAGTDLTIDSDIDIEDIVP